MRTKVLSFGMLWLALAQIMVALNIVISKSLLMAVPVMPLMAIRFGIATLLLLPLHWLSPQAHKPILTYFSGLQRLDWLYLIGQALCAGLLFNCLMLIGLHNTDANVAGIITSALPAMIALFAWLFLKEIISFKKALSIFLASLGLLFIAFNKLNSVGNQHSFFGDAMVLMSLVPEAAYYILTKVHPSKLPVFITAAILNAINAIILLPLAFLEYGNPFTVVSGHWDILFVLGFSAGFFYVFWLMGSKAVDGVLASLSTAIMPIATVLLAWWLLDDGINAHEIVGLALVLLSIMIYARQ